MLYGLFQTMTYFLWECCIAQLQIFLQRSSVEYPLTVSCINQSKRLISDNMIWLCEFSMVPLRNFRTLPFVDRRADVWSSCLVDVKQWTPKADIWRILVYSDTTASQSSRVRSADNFIRRSIATTFGWPMSKLGCWTFLHGSYKLLRDSS